jgi:hypothetical protein
VLSGTQDKYTDGSRFCVSSLKRVASGAFKARKRIPADVRAEYQALYGPTWEAKLTIPAGTTPLRAKALQRAKAQHAEWLAEVEGRIATLRGRNGLAKSGHKAHRSAN